MKLPRTLLDKVIALQAKDNLTDRDLSHKIGEHYMSWGRTKRTGKISCETLSSLAKAYSQLRDDVEKILLPNTTEKNKDIAEDSI